MGNRNQSLTGTGRMEVLKEALRRKDRQGGPGRKAHSTEAGEMAESQSS